MWLRLIPIDHAGKLHFRTRLAVDVGKNRIIAFSETDSYAQRFKQVYPGLSSGRADIIRMLLTRAVESSSPALDINPLLQAMATPLSSEEKKLIRIYTDEEIKNFEEDDRLPQSLAKKIRKKFPRK